MPQHLKTEDGFTLGQWVGRQRRNKDSLSAERRKLLESSCKDWTWNRFDDQWNEGFEQLKQYVKQIGSARVPYGFKTKDGFALGTWVQSQRKNKDSLSAERRKLIESSCKDWTWDALTDRWSEGFEQLKQYVKKNKSARVPRDFKTKDGFALGIWVNTQRARKDSLSDERRSLLESSCKDWTWDILTDRWGERFEQLKQYVKKIGSARVPFDFKTEDGFALGSWVSTQRANKDSLSVERRKLLESCKGWTWDALTDRWSKGFEQLKKYVKAENSARVPQGFKTEDGFTLGTWISNQRKHKESLSAERRKLLESSCKDWTWDLYDDQWSEAFEQLKKHGSARVPTSFKTKDGFALGNWLGTQRRNKDSLSAERRKLLESSCKDWTWDALTDQWAEAFEQLKQYVNKIGSARVPFDFKTEDGFALGTWVSTQRANKDSLSAEQRNLLESSCKDWSWDALTDKWRGNFEQLKQYAKKTKSARVPATFKTKDGITLGQWARTQRRNKDSLSAERRKLLESLNGWSWGVIK